MTIHPLILLALSTILSSCSPSAFAGGCLHEAPRHAEITIAGAANVRIVAGAGSLTVVGKDGVGAISARGTACAEKSTEIEGIQLIAERRGDTLWIESVFADRTNPGNRGLSFTVELPDSLPLEVKDGSGSLEIRNVGALRLTDGSGEATISGVHGDLVVDDGSGGLDVSDIHGSANIKDSSGTLRIRKVEGPVDVQDGSGSLTIEDIRGELAVDDGSGGLTIRHIVGNVRLRDGSGGIDVDDVEGDVTISEAGSGGVSVRNTSGRVDVPKER